jgi:hypothetical protein
MAKNEDNQIVLGIKWNTEHEEILIDWADKALCYKWLHSKNYDRYNRFNILFTIPVIIMSTLTGTANFAQDRVPPDLRSYYSMIIGGVNILAGIITTIQNFLKISQINEAHRVSAISWDKFYRKIKVELAKSPIERQSVEIYLKNCTEEYDRLMETSPNIDKKIIIKFKKTFQGKVLKDKDGNDILNDNQKSFKQLSKPEICDSLESVRKSVYKEKEPPKTIDIDSEKKNNSVIEKQSNIISNSFLEVVKRRKELTEKEKVLELFCKDFYDKYSRNPTEEEIFENLDNNKYTSDVISTWLYKKTKKNILKDKEDTERKNETVNDIENQIKNNISSDSIDV